WASRSRPSAPARRRGMATRTVRPRPTPAGRADTPVELEVDEDLSVFAATLEDWVAPRQNWELLLHEGHENGRVNNVEARLLYVSGDQTSSISFRLDQLEVVDDVIGELVLRFEERDGICKLVHCTSNG